MFIVLAHDIDFALGFTADQILCVDYIYLCLIDYFVDRVFNR